MEPKTLYNTAHQAGMEALEKATPTEMIVLDERNEKIYRVARGGYSIPCYEGNQSMELKEAYTAAFADVLYENGLNVYTSSRMD